MNFEFLILSFSLYFYISQACVQFNKSNITMGCFIKSDKVLHKNVRFAVMGGTGGFINFGICFNNFDYLIHVDNL